MSHSLQRTESITTTNNAVSSKAADTLSTKESSKETKDASSSIVISTQDNETMTDSTLHIDSVSKSLPGELIPAATASTLSADKESSEDHVKSLLQVMHVYSRYTGITQKELPTTLVYFAQVEFITLVIYICLLK